jgi:hypothetical protein
LLEWLDANREASWLRGRRARRAFETHYDLPTGVQRITAVLCPGAPVQPENKALRGTADVMLRS